MEAIRMYEWPNGVRNVAGGTRTLPHFSRPWQQRIMPDPTKCPFCTGQGNVLKSFFNGQWLLLKNLYTPYAFHQMIIPKSCSDDESLRRLCGKQSILEAVSLIWSEIESSEKKNLLVNVHVGVLAGQNIPHLHYHIVDYAMDDKHRSVVLKKMLRYCDDHQDLVVYAPPTDPFKVCVGGTRVGQCFLLPIYNDVINHNPGIVHGLADMIDFVLARYGEKFRSLEGLAPDFSLSLLFEEAKLKYGLYTPVLNHWGGAEQIAFYEGFPRTLPWPHETTAEHLRSS